MIPTQTSPFDIISIEETEKLLNEDGTVTYAGILDATGLLPMLHNVYMEQLLAHTAEDYIDDLPDEKAGIVFNANIVFSKSGKMAIDIERVMVNRGYSFSLPIEFWMADALGFAFTVTPVPMIQCDKDVEEEDDDSLPW